MKSFIFTCLTIFASTFSWAQTYFSSANLISSGTLDAPNTVYAGDIDGDGDIDVLAGSDYNYKIVWYENRNGVGDFGPERIVSSSASLLESLSLADLDGDGDLDVLACFWCSGKILWYQNLDGHGMFSPAKVVTTSLVNAYGAVAADIDSDGSLDILCASYEDGHIIWFKNLDGLGNFGQAQIISTSIPGADRVKASDLDGDGDADVISEAYMGNFIAWQENKDGQAIFGDPQIITTSVDSPMSIDAEDMDGDGDMDVLSASRNDGKIAWYENLDGKGHFGTQRLMPDSIGGPNNVIACDIDTDGDRDIVATAMYEDQVVWFKNLDGHGNFGTRQIITSGFDFPSSLFTADLDGDGDPDVISTSYNGDELDWFRNITLKILMQPLSVAICAGQAVSYSITAKDYTGFRWQVSSGTTFTDLTDDSIYSGTATSVLQISFADTTMSGLKFRCCVYNAGFTIYSDEVLLIVGDLIPPVISNYPGNQIVYAFNDCSATLPDYTRFVVVSDNCDSIPTLTQDPVPGTLVTGDIESVTLTARDHSGNTASVSFTVEVIDTIKPDIICPGSRIIQLESGKEWYTVKDHVFDPVSDTDNCAGYTVMNNLNHSGTLDGQNIPPGTITITWTIVDKSNNQADCELTITVDRSEEGIHIYPNPTSGNLFFKYNRDDITRVLFFDITGKPVLEKPVTQKNEEIDLSELPEGLYFVRIIAINETLIRKIVRVD